MEKFDLLLISLTAPAEVSILVWSALCAPESRLLSSVLWICSYCLTFMISISEKERTTNCLKAGLEG